MKYIKIKNILITILIFCLFYFLLYNYINNNLFVETFLTNEPILNYITYDEYSRKQNTKMLLPCKKNRLSGRCCGGPIDIDENHKPVGIANNNPTGLPHYCSDNEESKVTQDLQSIILPKELGGVVDDKYYNKNRNEKIDYQEDDVKDPLI